MPIFTKFPSHTLELSELRFFMKEIRKKDHHSNDRKNKFTHHRIRKRLRLPTTERIRTHCI